MTSTLAPTIEERCARWQSIAREFGLENPEVEGPDVELDVQEAVLVFSLDGKGRALVTMRVLAPTGDLYVLDMLLEPDCIEVDDGLGSLVV